MVRRRAQDVARRRLQSHGPGVAGLLNASTRRSRIDAGWPATAFARPEPLISVLLRSGTVDEKRMPAGEPTTCLPPIVTFICGRARAGSAQASEREASEREASVREASELEAGERERRQMVRW